MFLNNLDLFLQDLVLLFGRRLFLRSQIASVLALATNDISELEIVFEKQPGLVFKGDLSLVLQEARSRCLFSLCSYSTLICFLLLPDQIVLDL